MQDTRAFDVIVWGASGFTGRLVAEYIYKKYGVEDKLKWAMAGRNQEKLERIRSEFADPAVPILLADSQDQESLEALAKKAKVICTTVGPYGKYGSKLVAACVRQGTHYCDLAGEVIWMRKMIDQHHTAAQEKQVKIVHTCGFDSIPSDMGVYFMQQKAVEKTGQPATQIRMRVRGAKGGLSGGTYASLGSEIEKAEQNKKLYGILIKPYSLNPEGEQEGPDKRDLQKVVYDEVSRNWIFPFIMAMINTKVVRRSNALAGYPYGKNFQYEEATMAGSGWQGKLKAYMAALPLGLIRMAKPGSLLKKGIDWLMPSPGEGPTEAQREAGYFNLRFYNTLADGRVVVGKVTGDKDPGYGSTCKMLAESAICLAKDETLNTYGVLTPSVAMGDVLLERLQANAGLTFSFGKD